MVLAQQSEKAAEDGDWRGFGDAEVGVGGFVRCVRSIARRWHLGVEETLENECWSRVVGYEVMGKRRCDIVRWKSRRRKMCVNIGESISQNNRFWEVFVLYLLHLLCMLHYQFINYGESQLV